MTLTNTKSEETVNCDVELTKPEETVLIEYAKRHILDDRNTLLSWAINNCIKNACGIISFSENIKIP